MQGKITDFSIPDIFQLVSSQGKSGSLSISGNDRVTVFLFPREGSSTSSRTAGGRNPSSARCSGTRGT